jgi:hypothetical protein
MNRKGGLTTLGNRGLTTLSLSQLVKTSKGPPVDRAVCPPFHNRAVTKQNRDQRERPN